MRGRRPRSTVGRGPRRGCPRLPARRRRRGGGRRRSRPGGLERAAVRLGANGTVLGACGVADVETAEATIRTGTALVATPDCARPVVRHCNRRGVSTLVGVTGPAAAETALADGATALRVPAADGGAALARVRRRMGPRPTVVGGPAGGPERAAAFRDAGATAVAADHESYRAAVPGDPSAAVTVAAARARQGVASPPATAE